MAKNCDQIEKPYFHYFLKNDLYMICIYEKYKKLISKGFFQNFIFEILKKLRNYGRYGRGKNLKF
jgi:hypothetical protein